MDLILPPFLPYTQEDYQAASFAIKHELETGTTLRARIDSLVMAELSEQMLFYAQLPLNCGAQRSSKDMDKIQHWDIATMWNEWLTKIDVKSRDVGTRSYTISVDTLHYIRTYKGSDLRLLAFYAFDPNNMQFIREGACTFDEILVAADSSYLRDSKIDASKFIWVNDLVKVDILK